MNGSKNAQSEVISKVEQVSVYECMLRCQVRALVTGLPSLTNPCNLSQDVADCAGYDYNAATEVCRLLRSLDTLQVRYQIYIRHVTSVMQKKCIKIIKQQVGLTLR